MAKPASGIMNTSVTPPAVRAMPALVAVQSSNCWENCGCSTVLALSTPPTSIIRKQQMAKFLKRKSRRLMSGSFCRNSQTNRPAMPKTNRKQKKRIKPEENQSFSSPLSSMICKPPMARIRKARPI